METIDNKFDFEDVIVRVKNFYYELEDALETVKNLEHDKLKLSSLVEEHERQIAELKRQLAELNRKLSVPTKKDTADKIALSDQKVDEALKLYQRSDYNGAIKLCTEAVSLNPNNQRAYFNRGLVYHWQRQYNYAVADYDKALQLDPNDAVAKCNRQLCRAALRK